ncbi:MAG: histidinol-phosphate transaminase [Mobilitalea sp.]
MKPWEKNIRNVVPYVAGEQPNKKDMVKLNTNENPYPPAPGVQRILSEINTDLLRLYPDGNAQPLVKELAHFYKVKEEQIFVGVGSDDVLAMAFLTFFNSEKPILFPDITYSFYTVWCDLFKIPYQTQPLDENFYIKIEDYNKENGGVVIANPNAPSSIYVGLTVIEDIIKTNQDSIVVIDEAYIDFAGKSAINLIEKYENLLVVQTFSKSRSMAGMRIGYAIGNPVLINALNNVKNSYNSYTMNLTSILAGVEAVKDVKHFEEGIRKVVEVRAFTEQKLSEMGFTFPKSGTNFIFAAHEKVPAKAIFEHLRNHNIYVRHFNVPRIDNHLRITIGTKEEMERLLDCLQAFLQG